MPSYAYICKHCNKGFREMVAVDERDMVTCDDCHEVAERQFEGTTAFKLGHLSKGEKAIHRDLIEANKLEREAACNNTYRKDEEQVRIEKEVQRLKFTD